MPRLPGGSFLAGASLLGVAVAAACASGRAAPPATAIDVPVPSAAPAVSRPDAAPAPTAPPRRPASCPTPEEPISGMESDGTCRDEATCQKECDYGSAAACVTAGDIQPQQRADPARVLRQYARACRLGNVLGCTFYGGTLRSLHYDDPDDVACAARLFVIACQHDEAEACGMLGRVYELGEGVPRDRDKALQALLRGCRPSLSNKGGVALACRRLVELLQASSKPSDPLTRKAIDRARRIGCNSGSPEACATVQGTPP